VHWYRNIFSHMLSTKVREIGAMLNAIEDIVVAREKAIRVSRSRAASIGGASAPTIRSSCCRSLSRARLYPGTRGSFFKSLDHTLRLGMMARAG
jgi:hypothetical protein